MLPYKDFLDRLFCKPCHLVAIVVPVYKTHMSVNERVAFMRCLKILKNHPIYIIAPNTLDLSNYLQIASHIQVRRFPDHFFNGIPGYNSLMLSWKFYQTFLPYKYILIYQLDCYVFKDELSYWCQQEYDYIGAPWINEKYLKCDYVNQRLPGWIKRLINRSDLNKNVGNGGLSLRKTKTFYFFSFILIRTIRKWVLYEDIFWSFIPALLLPFAFKVPDTNTALSFSFETDPATCFRLNNNKLPFGCHAWEKYDSIFWQQYIEQPL